MAAPASPATQPRALPAALARTRARTKFPPSGGTYQSPTTKVPCGRTRAGKAISASPATAPRLSPIHFECGSPPGVAHATPLRLLTRTMIHPTCTPQSGRPSSSRRRGTPRSFPPPTPCSAPSPPPPPPCPAEVLGTGTSKWQPPRGDQRRRPAASSSPLTAPWR